MKKSKKQEPFSTERSTAHTDHLEAHEDHDRWFKDLARWRTDYGDAIRRLARQLLPEIDLADFEDRMDRHEAAILAHEELVDRHELSRRQHLELEEALHEILEALSSYDPTR